MRKIIIISLSFIILFSLTYAYEWGKMEISTEVNSSYGQDFNISFERWWSDNLGLGSSILYNTLNKEINYHLFIQSPHLKIVSGLFYPSLNLFTNNLRLNGYQLSLYLGNNEIFYLSGKGSKTFEDLPSLTHLEPNIPLKILGWSTTFSNNNYLTLFILSLNKNNTENYMADILFVRKIHLPLGFLLLAQETNLYLKDSNLNFSVLFNGEINIGSLGIRGFIGYLNGNTLSLSSLDEGDLGFKLSLALPLSSKIFPEYSIGYFYNTKDNEHKIDLGIKAQWNVTNNLNVEGLVRYLINLSGKNYIFTKLALNFPALEGAMWNSLYIKHELKEDSENTSLGMKISYQF
uniref:Uncharacterized protein n=1 Tax=Dictyoglomus thermophilum TaxID=14 RepID=A0A7C3MJP1_DICTH